jgi:predicted membrane metal-binding protein
VNVPIAALLAAFAAGAALLQTCARLPPAPGVLLAVATGLTTAMVGAAVLAHRPDRRSTASMSAAVLVPRYASGSAPALAFCFGAAAAVAAGLSGFSYAGWRAQARLADELPAAWEERELRITGIVDDLPQQTTNGTRFAFAVETVDTPGAIVPHRVSLGWFARASDDDVAFEAPIVHAGERWSLAVRLKRPHGNVNPDGFDLEAWLLERNLRATGHVRDSTSNVRAAAFAGRFDDYVQRARERIRSRIAQALPAAPYAGVITALAIGDQRAVPEWQ